MKLQRWIATLPLLAATAAQAHTGDHSHMSSFVDGMLHPLTGPDHLAAMLAVGIWSAMALKSPLRAPIAFAASLLAGALLSMFFGWHMPAMETAITVSLAVLGLLVALRLAMPPAAGAATAAILAFSHGAAHGLELHGATALAGMVVGTAVLHGIGLAMGWKLRNAPTLARALLGASVAALAVARVSGVA